MLLYKTEAMCYNHSDLSVKQEVNNDILEPTSSGRKYIKKNIIKKNLNILFYYTIFKDLMYLLQG